MIQVALSIQRDGAIKVFEGQRVFAGAAHDAASGGLNIPEGDIVVGCLENIFRVGEEAQRFLPLSLLKEQPAFLNLNDGSEDLVV